MTIRDGANGIFLSKVKAGEVGAAMRIIHVHGNLLLMN
jgi:hypothetical protein